MLRRPHPWVNRRIAALWRRWRSLRSRLSSGTARLRFGPLVVPAGGLEHRLVEAANAVSGGREWMRAILLANIAAHGLEVVDAAADYVLSNPEAARPQARVRLALALAAIHEASGGIFRPLALLEATAGGAPPSRRMSMRLRALHRQARLLDAGIPSGAPIRRPWEPAPGSVLYYASQTLPHHSSGYSIRTHWLARTLRDKGWALSVATRLGYPNDRYDFIGVRTVEPAWELDGVPYRFTPERRRGSAIEAYHEASVEALLRQCEAVRPSILHAASNHTCGLAGTEAAKRLGIPSIYEVRGLWHMTRGAADPTYLDSDHYRMIERLEVQAATQADHVFAITDAAKQVLVAGGVADEKISVLPNAVEPSAFVARAQNAALARQWRLEERTVIGYVGSFKHYEGLDTLLEAAAQLRKLLGDSFRVLLVGDGDAELELRALARRLDLASVVRFTGRVPHPSVPDYYALCDIFAFPRKGLRLCEVVSPIKPFEALAAQKAVVVSDVRALTEIVRHEETGLVHRRDDVDSLTEQLERLLRSPTLRDALARRGKAWVLDHRTWSRVCDEVDHVYRRLTGYDPGRSCLPPMGFVAHTEETGRFQDDGRSPVSR